MLDLKKVAAIQWTGDNKHAVSDWLFRFGAPMDRPDLDRSTILFRYKGSLNQCPHGHWLYVHECEIKTAPHALFSVCYDPVDVRKQF